MKQDPTIPYQTAETIPNPQTIPETRRTQRVELAALLLALGGGALSLYLTIVHYDRNALVCGVGDCHTVQSSSYAVALGVPVAVWGLAMYALLALLGTLRLVRPGLAWPITLTALLLTFGGVLYSAYLTYLELAVIDAICQWCVVSALLVTGLLIAEAIIAANLLGAPLEA